MRDVEALRAEFEDRLLAIKGVVGVGSGPDGAGQWRLRVYSAVPQEQLRAQLPPELDPDAVQIVEVGEIVAQGLPG